LVFPEPAKLDVDCVKLIWEMHSPEYARCIYCCMLGLGNSFKGPVS